MIISGIDRAKTFENRIEAATAVASIWITIAIRPCSISHLTFLIGHLIAPLSLERNDPLLVQAAIFLHVVVAWRAAGKEGHSPVTRGLHCPTISAARFFDRFGKTYAGRALSLEVDYQRSLFYIDANPGMLGVYLT